MKLYYRILKIYELKRKNRMEKRDLYNSDRIKTGETIFKGEDIPKDRYRRQEQHIVQHNQRNRRDQHQKLFRSCLRPTKSMRIQFPD